MSYLGEKLNIYLKMWDWGLEWKLGLFSDIVLLKLLNGENLG